MMQIKLLEVQTIMSYMKYTYGIKSRLYTAESMISELEDISVGTLKIQTQREMTINKEKEHR